jgi:hypothetical protein
VYTFSEPSCIAGWCAGNSDSESTCVQLDVLLPWLYCATGNGDSEGTFRFANYWGEMREMHAAKQHLQQHEGQTVIGLLGECTGLLIFRLGFAVKCPSLPFFQNCGTAVGA